MQHSFGRYTAFPRSQRDPRWCEGRNCQCLFASGVGLLCDPHQREKHLELIYGPGVGDAAGEARYRAYDVTSQFANNKDSSFADCGSWNVQVWLPNSFRVGAHDSTATCKHSSCHCTFHSQMAPKGRGNICNGQEVDGGHTANPIRYSVLYHGEQYDGRAAAPVPSSEWRPWQSRSSTPGLAAPRPPKPGTWKTNAADHAGTRSFTTLHSCVCY